MDDEDGDTQSEEEMDGMEVDGNESDTEEENNYDSQSCVADHSQLIMVNVQSGTIGTVWYSE